MIDKKERQAKVDFVDYLSSGIAFMVAKGNPEGLKNEMDLCGRTVAVEKSATGDIVADDISADCVQAGKDKLKELPLPEQVGTLQALSSGRADAVLALDLTLAYNVKQQPEAFEMPAKPFGLLPVGIPVPKTNPELRDAVAGRARQGPGVGHVRRAAGQVEPHRPGTRGRADQPGRVTREHRYGSRPARWHTPTNRSSA